MKFCRLALAACAVVFAANAAFAQSGGITVRVMDQEGAPLPGATVTISHETGYVKTTTELSSAKGIVEFPVLKPGQGYTITVAFPGFATFRQTDLRVKIGESQTLPVQLAEELVERVRVTAQTEVIDIDKSESSTKFTDDFIDDLPVAGRFYQNVLTMAPGVQDADGDGNPNVHGSRDRDFQAIVGDVSNVDPLTGQWLSRINPNSIEEMEVITAGAGVEFGRAQGGFARIIQKQGSNTHEGVFEFYWRTSKLDGNGARDTSAQPTPEFDSTQPLFQFSGPLVKDKLWYRASYERQDTEQPINVLSGIELLEINTETQDAQVTWQASPRNKLAFQFRADPFEANNLGLSSLTTADASRSAKREVETFTVKWTAPYSPKVLVENTIAWQDVQTKVGPSSNGVANNCLGADEQPFLLNAQCTDLDTGARSGSYFRTDDDNRQRLTARGQATIYGGRFWGMSHQFKLGLNIENERYFRDLTRSPNLSFFVVTTQVNDPSNPDINDPGETSFESFGIAAARVAVPESDDIRATGTNWGLFVEDQFKPRQNLTMTLGMRIDREEINSEGREQFSPIRELQRYLDLDANAPGGGGDDGSIWPGAFLAYEDFSSFETGLQQLICGQNSADDISACLGDVSVAINADKQLDLERKRRAESINLNNTNVSPFFSIAWSPWSNGKTALKAAVGRHYNNIPLLVPLVELEPAFTDIDYRVDLSTGATQIQGGISPTVNVSTVSRDLSTPYQDEVSFSVERELWAETSIKLTYIDRAFRDQIQDINTNLDIGDLGRCAVMNSFDDDPVVKSPGVGDLVDPYSGETYFDNDPGDGDGILDDCVGRTISVDINPDSPSAGQFGADVQRLQRPDEITDLYVQNPFWGDIFEVGNYNQIDYQAVVLELVRRQYRSWEMNGSYTWSEAKGDGEDFFQELGDDPSLRDNVSGFQSYDQTHVVKVNATTITPWGLRLGGSLSWQSGLPYSVLFQQPSRDTLPPQTVIWGNLGNRIRQSYVTGARNDQRNSAFWNLDLKATKEFRLGRGLNLQLSAELFNALDDDTLLIYNPTLGRGVNVNGNNEALRRFGRQWQVGMKVAF